MKKSALYTRTGDKGTTLISRRVSEYPKLMRWIESYGTIDELNSFVGLLMTEITDPADQEFLRFVQHKLFTIGSYLANRSG